MQTTRTRTFNIRFSDDEWDRLARLTEHFGLTAAGVLRLLLMEKDREVRATPRNIKRKASGSKAKRTSQGRS